MSDALSIYLNDHLAGAMIARQLLDVMQKQNEDEHFRLFAKNLLPQIEQDDQTLRSIIDKIHSSPSTIKQAGGRLLEKGARAKLGHARSTTFELFESLELLLLGIQGKVLLWKALRNIATRDDQLRPYDFEELIRRALKQCEEVESERIALAPVVFD